MRKSSSDNFKHHFSLESLDSIVESNLKAGLARGVDGVSYERFMSNKDEHLALINRKVLDGSYKFTPFREKLLLKGAHQAPRQVSIPTIRDRVTLRALNNFLLDTFPQARPTHSHHTVSAVISSIREAGPNQSFIKLDIKTFYDDIDHKILLKNLGAKIRFQSAQELLHAALTTSTGKSVADDEKRVKGVPQGLSISNILASIYLMNIDRTYNDHPHLSYHRYVDDILCIAPSEMTVDFLKEIQSSLKKKKRLEIHKIGSGKSVILQSSERLDYLGYSFFREKVSVREKSIQKLLNSLMQIIHTTKEPSLKRSLWRLNLRISGCQYQKNKLGWMFYFSQIDDLSLLVRIDAQIRKAFIRKFGTEKAKECKRLIKTYHEIKYNLKRTNYVPNFDVITNVDKRAILEVVEPMHNYVDHQVEAAFDRLIAKEIRDMERDTIEALS
jgi:RNA-directed DNA polymerase